MIKIKIVGFVGKVEKVGNDPINCKKTDDQTRCIFSLERHFVHFDFKHQNDSQCQCDDNHVVNSHFRSELFPVDSNVWLFGDQINGVNDIGKHNEQYLHDCILIGCRYQYRDKEFV